MLLSILFALIGSLLVDGRLANWESLYNTFYEMMADDPLYPASHEWRQTLEYCHELYDGRRPINKGNDRCSDERICSLPGVQCRDFDLNPRAIYLIRISELPRRTRQWKVEGDLFLSNASFPDITSIYVSGQAISGITFDIIPNKLTLLGLDGNELTSFPFEQLKGSKLAVLDLKANLISEPFDLKSVRHASKLMYFNLEFNEIPSITFGKNKRCPVDNLHLQGNPVTSIDFHGIESWNMIWLALDPNWKLTTVRAIEEIPTSLFEGDHGEDIHQFKTKFWSQNERFLVSERESNDSSDEFENEEKQQDDGPDQDAETAASSSWSNLTIGLVIGGIILVVVVALVLFVTFKCRPAKPAPVHVMDEVAVIPGSKPHHTGRNRFLWNMNEEVRGKHGMDNILVHEFRATPRKVGSMEGVYGIQSVTEGNLDQILETKKDGVVTKGAGREGEVEDQETIADSMKAFLEMKQKYETMAENLRSKNENLRRENDLLKESVQKRDHGNHFIEKKKLIERTNVQSASSCCSCD